MFECFVMPFSRPTVYVECGRQLEVPEPMKALGGKLTISALVLSFIPFSSMRSSRSNLNTHGLSQEFTSKRQARSCCLPSVETVQNRPLQTSTLAHSHPLLWWGLHSQRFPRCNAQSGTESDLLHWTSRLAASYHSQKLGFKHKTVRGRINLRHMEETLYVDILAVLNAQTCLLSLLWPGGGTTGAEAEAAKAPEPRSCRKTGLDLLPSQTQQTYLHSFRKKSLSHKQALSQRTWPLTPASKRKTT